MKQTPRKHLLRIKVHSPTGGEENYIDVETSYQKDATPRGSYLHVAPVVAKGQWLKYKAYSGVKVHLEPMTRFSAKRFEAYEPDPRFVADIVNRVAKSQGLEHGWPEEAA